MDWKRFNKITWQEAVVKWSNGEHVFSSTGRTYYMEDDTLHFFLGGEDNGSESTAFFNDITKEEWYVKKPFDVRAEMLSRPNEWVGAYKNKANVWIKVGFDSKCMGAILTICSEDIIKPDCESDFCNVAHHSVLDICIPIEDVPKEELT